MVLISVSWEITSSESPNSVTSVTFGGKPAESVNFTQVTASNNWTNRVETWRVMESDIDTGTSDAVVNLSLDPGQPIVVGGASFFGVDQGPVLATETNTALSSSSISMSITTNVDNALIFSNVGSGQNRSITHQSGQIERWFQGHSQSSNAGSSLIAGTAGSYSIAESVGSSTNRLVLDLSAYAPPAGAPPPPPPPPPPTGQISLLGVDAFVSPSPTTTTNSLAHTIADGEDRMVVVCISWENSTSSGAGQVSSVSLDGNLCEFLGTYIPE